MAASNQYVSFPKPFASGNISGWFRRFDICCDANEWDNDKRATKLPTLLEGEARAVWLELSAKESQSVTCLANHTKHVHDDRAVPAEKAQSW